MDETSLPTPPIAEQAPPQESSRPDRRHRAREILSKQYSRLDRLEGELTDQIQQLADEVARELSAAGGENAAAITDAAHEARVTAQAQQLDRLRDELASRDEALERATAELEKVRIELARSEQELRVHGSMVAEAQGRDERTRVDLATLSEQLADTRAQLTAARERQEELRREATSQQQALEQYQEKTKDHRRQLAREFKAQHSAQAKQLEEQQAEIARLQAAVDQAGAEQTRLVNELRETAGPRADDVEQLHKLHQERDNLSQQLAAARRNWVSWNT